MRNLLTIASLVCFLFFISCSEDNDTDPSPIGSWNITSFNSVIAVDGQNITRWYTDNLGLSEEEAQQIADAFQSNPSEGNLGITYIFNADGTFVIEDEDLISSGTWTQMGSTLNMTLGDENEEDTLTYQILILTSSNMHLLALDEIREDLNGDGTDELISITLNIEFEAP